MSLTLYADRAPSVPDAMVQGANKTFQKTLAGAALTGLAVRVEVEDLDPHRRAAEFYATVTGPSTISYEVQSADVLTAEPGYVLRKVFGLRFFVEHGDGSETQYPGAGYQILHVGGAARRDEIGFVEGIKSEVYEAGVDAKAGVEQAEEDGVDAVLEARNDAVGAVGAAGTAQVGAVNTAGGNQVGAVNAAGGAQVEAIGDAGAAQVQAVQAVADVAQGLINLKPDASGSVLETVAEGAYFSVLVADGLQLYRKLGGVAVAQGDPLPDQGFLAAIVDQAEEIKSETEQVRENAEALLDAALDGQGAPYATLDAGMTASADDDVFGVLLPRDAAIAYFQKVSGKPVFLRYRRTDDSFPGSELIPPALDGSWVFNVLDPFDKVAFGVTPDNTIHLSNIGTLERLPPNTQDLVIAYLDPNGLILDGVTREKRRYYDAAPVAAAARWVRLIGGNGQSNIIGSHAVELLTTVQPFLNRMLADGIIAGGGQEANPNHSSLVPLIETLDEFDGLHNETGFAALANWLTWAERRMWRSTGAGEETRKYVAFTTGTGARTVREVGKDPVTEGVGASTSYEDQLACWTAIRNHLAAEGETPDRDYIHVMDIGEANENIETDRATMLADLQNYYDDLLADWRAFIGDDEARVYLFLRQTTDEAESEVALAQMDAHLDETRDIYLVGGQYATTWADDQHRDSHGHRHMGLQAALAIHAVVNLGGTETCIRPVSAVRTGTSVKLRLAAPDLPIVPDTSFVSDPGQYGLVSVDDDTSATITAVAQTGFDELTLTLSGVPTGANHKIRCAWTAPTARTTTLPTTGVRSCLRDSCSEDLLYNDAGGVRYKPHRYSPTWEIAVTT